MHFKPHRELHFCYTYHSHHFFFTHPVYADDTQIYVSFNYKDQNDLKQVKSCVEACLVDIMNWMSENKLKLNTDKTELLILSSKFRAEPIFPVLTVGSDIITPTPHARNIGVTFDKFLPMSIDRFHLTSRRPCWCTKTMKWRPYWCTVRELALSYSNISYCFTTSLGPSIT